MRFAVIALLLVSACAPQQKLAMCPDLPAGAIVALDVNTGLPFVNSPHRYTCVGRTGQAPEVVVEQQSDSGVASALTSPLEWAAQHAVVPVTP